MFLIQGGYTSIPHLFCGIFVAAIIETLYVGLTSYWKDPFFGHSILFRLEKDAVPDFLTVNPGLPQVRR